jgi:hypothetical protein
MRAAPHEDINLITILVAANGAGLELLDRDGQWLPVETAPENLIVDAGDGCRVLFRNPLPMANALRVVDVDRRVAFEKCGNNCALERVPHGGRVRRVADVAADCDRDRGHNVTNPTGPQDARPRRR